MYRSNILIILITQNFGHLNGNCNDSRNGNGNGFRHFTIFGSERLGNHEGTISIFFLQWQRNDEEKNGNGTGTVHRNERSTVTLFRWKTKYSNAF